MGAAYQYKTSRQLEHKFWFLMVRITRVAKSLRASEISEGRVSTSPPLRLSCAIIVLLCAPCHGVTCDFERHLPGAWVL